MEIKKNWQSTDGVTNADMNRIETNIETLNDDKMDKSGGDFQGPITIMGKPIAGDVVGTDRYEKIIYVDSQAILSGDGTRDNPYNNFYLAAEELKVINYGKVTFEVLKPPTDGYDSVSLEGLFTNGQKYFGGEIHVKANGHRMWGLEIVGQGAQITIEGAVFDNYLKLENCSYLYFLNCKFDFTDNNFSQGLIRAIGSRVHLYGGEIIKPPSSCIWADDSNISLEGVKFTAGTNLNYYNAYNGGIIFISNPQYVGGTGLESKWGGGQIFKTT